MHSEIDQGPALAAQRRQDWQVRREAMERFADAPDGLIQTMIGERDAGKVLTTSRDVAVVSATGSVPMGHADAGYETAIACAKDNGLNLPSLQARERRCRIQIGKVISASLLPRKILVLNAPHECPFMFIRGLT